MDNYYNKFLNDVDFCNLEKSYIMGYTIYFEYEKEKIINKYIFNDDTNYNNENPCCVYSYNNLGELENISYYNAEGVLHRTDEKPAFKSYYPNGYKKIHSYYCDGLDHRGGRLPSKMAWDKKGNLIIKEYFVNGENVNKEMKKLERRFDIIKNIIDGN